MQRTLAAAGLALAALTWPSPVHAQPAFDPSAHRLVDLSHAFNSQTLYWPTSPSGFELKTLAAGPTPGGWYYSAHTLCTPEHGGTHLDAPIHFAEGRRSTEQIPLGQLVAQAAVIDVTAQATADRTYRLTPDDIRAFERRHGTIARGTMVLLRTGWSRHWGDRKAYFGSDVPGDASHLSFPSFGLEAARLLVEERGVGGIGVDTASIDYGPSTDFVVHRLAASRNVIGLENLVALDELPPVGAVVVALPMKTEGGSGGPVRVVALLPARERMATARGPVIVSPADVGRRLGSPGLVLLHVGDTAGYEAGHLPGARLVTLEAISLPRAEGQLNLQMAAPPELAAAFERLGVSDSSEIVVYFGKDQATPTARVVLALEYLGLGDRVSYLDGGLPAWQAAGLPLTAEAPEVVPGALTPRPRTSAIADAAWVAGNRAAAGVAVVDARLRQFYTGEDDGRGRYQRPGHITGARSIPFSTLLTPSGHFRTRAELEAIFREAGVGDGDTVVSYCHIGQQASLVYFVARYLGHHARVYDGSYEEWSARPDLPVAR